METRRSTHSRALQAKLLLWCPLLRADPGKPFVTIDLHLAEAASSDNRGTCVSTPQINVETQACLSVSSAKRISPRSHGEDGDHLIITLAQSGKELPFSSWATARPDAAHALSELCAANDLDDDPADQPLAIGDDHLRLAPRVLAGLDTATAALLGLPAPTPLALDLRAQNRIDQDDFRLTVRWVRPGGQPVRAQMRGAMLLTDAGPRRVPEPLWSLYSSAQPLTRALEKPERFEGIRQAEGALA